MPLQDLLGPVKAFFLRRYYLSTTLVVSIIIYSLSQNQEMRILLYVYRYISAVFLFLRTNIFALFLLRIPSSSLLFLKTSLGRPDPMYAILLSPPARISSAFLWCSGWRRRNCAPLALSSWRFHMHARATVPGSEGTIVTGHSIIISGQGGGRTNAR